MANTLIPIQTYTLTSTAASVTFSSIPQNYTDLKIVVSARTDRASVQDIMLLSFNGSTTSFSAKYLEGNGSTAGSYTDQARGFGNADGANATSNTFGNTELYIPNYTGSSNKSWSGDGVNETNATAAYSSLFAGLWSNTAAITSIALTGSSSNFVSGSTFTLYGISNGVKATGGTLTVAGGYAYHTFTSTGSFLPNQRIKNAEVLIVSGGGGGGGLGGGGGAGGVLYSSSQVLTAGSSYTALVGAGGGAGTGGSTRSRGVKGSQSVFASISPQGGGSGAGHSDNLPANLSGGSGGGGSNSAGNDLYIDGGAGTAGQGNAGGRGYRTGGGYNAIGGGGGAGGAGGDGTGSGNAPIGGNGGNGTSAYSSWHAITGTGVFVNGTYYIAGGASGSFEGSAAGSPGTPGLGGGGLGGGRYTIATAGTANTGGGGGGGGVMSNGSVVDGTAGGSGLIIVRYPLS